MLGVGSFGNSHHPSAVRINHDDVLCAAICGIPGGVDDLGSIWRPARGCIEPPKVFS